MKTDKIRPTIYLDMDGVLTDFVGDVANRIRFEGDIYREWRSLLRKNKVGDPYSLEGVLGTTTDKLWSTIDAWGLSFWACMHYYPWANHLYIMLGEYGDVVILTSPSLSPNAFAGKVNSLQGWLGRGFREFILCPSQLKHKLANKTSILIDDSEKNIRKFKEAGGHPILFPQPWNYVDTMLPILPYIEGKVVSTINFINTTQGDNSE